MIGATRCPDCGSFVPRDIRFDSENQPFWECPICGTIHEDHRWYKYVSAEEAEEIIAHRGRRGLFVLDTGIEIIGIDNSTGDAWVEEFPDLTECLFWLAREKEKSPYERTQEFDVFLLDVWAGDDGDWIENERHLLGSVSVTPEIGEDLDDMDVLLAVKGFSFKDTLGRVISALGTTDRRVVYAEDLYGDGRWWEVGTVKDHKPVYGLRLKGEVA